MKKILLVMGLCLLLGAAKAQDGFQYGLIKGGVQQPDTRSVTAGLDVVTRYHNSVELALSFENSKTENNEMFLSLIYKPVLKRGKNSSLKFRLGLQGGSDSHDFIWGPQGGWEWQYSLSGNLDFLVVNSYSYCRGSGRSWRIGVELGFRFTI